MRFFEFAGDDNLDKFIVIIKNYIGRHASAKAPIKLNWSALDQIVKSSGVELMADYDTFKAMYDTNPILQSLVKDFNADGVELNVPGVQGSEEPTQDGQTSQEKVDQTAAGAAPQQLAQQTAPAQA